MTQIEGDVMMLLEAETTGAFAKSDLEIRPNPMAAFEVSVEAAGRIGRIMAGRLKDELAGTGVDNAIVKFGIKIDHSGAVMIAQTNDQAQFTVTLTVRTA